MTDKPKTCPWDKAAKQWMGSRSEDDLRTIDEPAAFEAGWKSAQTVVDELRKELDDIAKDDAMMRADMESALGMENTAEQEVPLSVLVDMLRANLDNEDALTISALEIELAYSNEAWKKMRKERDEALAALNKHTQGETDQ